jgi:hypothetical protein
VAHLTLGRWYYPPFSAGPPLLQRSNALKSLRRRKTTAIARARITLESARFVILLSSAGPPLLQRSRVESSS